MSPELGHTAFRIGLFLLLVSGALLFFLDRSSAEFFVTLITFLVALAFIGVVALLVRRK